MGLRKYRTEVEEGKEKEEYTNIAVILSQFQQPQPIPISNRRFQEEQDGRE